MYHLHLRISDNLILILIISEKYNVVSFTKSVSKFLNFNRELADSKDTYFFGPIYVEIAKQSVLLT